jgi:hypothetical protein
VPFPRAQVALAAGDMAYAMLSIGEPPSRSTAGARDFATARSIGFWRSSTNIDVSPHWNPYLLSSFTHQSSATAGVCGETNVLFFIPSAVTTTSGKTGGGGGGAVQAAPTRARLQPDVTPEVYCGSQTESMRCQQCFVDADQAHTLQFGALAQVSSQASASCLVPTQALCGTDVPAPANDAYT